MLIALNSNILGLGPVVVVWTVPALDEGLLHTCGPLWQRSTCRVLAHHWEKLQQQLGALRLPSTTLPTEPRQKETKRQLWIFSCSTCYLTYLNFSEWELFFHSVNPAFSILPLTWWGHTDCHVSSTGSGNTHWLRRIYEEAAPPSGVCCTGRLQCCRTGRLSACRDLLRPV